MTDGYATLPGEQISPADLRIPKARQVSEALHNHSVQYIEFVTCQREETEQSTREYIIIDAEVEVPQHKKHDIRRYERIAMVFPSEDDRVPEVLALRQDFPHVPHLNLRLYPGPRSLCLYDESYSELTLSWTAPRFLERIREWLALTARGELHDDDQPLEPLLVGSPHTLIIPPEMLAQLHSDNPARIHVTGVENGHGELVIMATPGYLTHQRQGLACVATAIAGDPQPHGVIHHAPTTLQELHRFLQAANINLVEELRTRLRSWWNEENRRTTLDCNLVLIVVLPKQRNAEVSAEVSDIWAFLTGVKVREIGQAIDIWQVSGKDEDIGLVLSPDLNKQGDSIGVILLKPTIAFSQEQAARFSGVAPEPDRKITVVGVGALGSHVFMNLLRMGYGKWTLIDDDYLLPHNLARHALDGVHLGLPKALSLSLVAQMMFRTSEVAQTIPANVLSAGEQGAAVSSALSEADVILDCSASVPVARHLVRDIDSSARRVSLFFNPSGSDGVLLVEDSARTLPLDTLEMQYYRFLLQEGDLRYHLQPPPGRIRYARSCRELSATIPQDLVALHAATGSRALRAALMEDTGAILVWRSSESDVSIRSWRIVPQRVVCQSVNGWHILTDQGVLDALIRLREERLPNETGGILVGALDTQRSLIYILDVIASPPDSYEWPTSYIRGCQGLQQLVADIEARTLEQVQYVGEWHSHPRGHSCALSPTDQQALSILAEWRGKEALPALMGIIGEGGQYGWYVAEGHKLSERPI
jgi:hypothetical protein